MRYRTSFNFVIVYVYMFCDQNNLTVPIIVHIPAYSGPKSKFPVVSNLVKNLKILKNTAFFVE